MSNAGSREKWSSWREDFFSPTKGRMSRKKENKNLDFSTLDVVHGYYHRQKNPWVWVVLTHAADRFCRTTADSLSKDLNIWSHRTNFSPVMWSASENRLLMATHIFDHIWWLLSIFPSFYIHFPPKNRDMGASHTKLSQHRWHRPSHDDQRHRKVEERVRRDVRGTLLAYGGFDTSKMRHGTIEAEWLVNGNPTIMLPLGGLFIP